MNCNGLAVFCRFWPEMAFRVEAADQHESHVVHFFLEIQKIPPCNKNKRIEGMQLPGYNKNTNREK